jgi:hypothetical protein
MTELRKRTEEWAKAHPEEWAKIPELDIWATYHIKKLLCIFSNIRIKILSLN